MLTKEQENSARALEWETKTRIGPFPKNFMYMEKNIVSKAIKVIASPHQKLFGDNKNCTTVKKR